MAPFPQRFCRLDCRCCGSARPSDCLIPHSAFLVLWCNSHRCQAFLGITLLNVKQRLLSWTQELPFFWGWFKVSWHNPCQWLGWKTRITCNVLQYSLLHLFSSADASADLLQSLNQQTITNQYSEVISHAHSCNKDPALGAILVSWWSCVGDQTDDLQITGEIALPSGLTWTWSRQHCHAMLLRRHCTGKTEDRRSTRQASSR